MDAILWLLPLAVALGAVFVGLFIVAARQGQFDDIDDEGRRILHGED